MCGNGAGFVLSNGKTELRLFDLCFDLRHGLAAVAVYSHESNVLVGSIGGKGGKPLIIGPGNRALGAQEENYGRLLARWLRRYRLPIVVRQREWRHPLANFGPPIAQAERQVLAVPGV